MKELLTSIGVLFQDETELEEYYKLLAVHEGIDGIDYNDFRLIVFIRARDDDSVENLTEAFKLFETEKDSGIIDTE